MSMISGIQWVKPGAKKQIWKVAALITALALLAIYAMERFTIGFDFQEYGCLEEKVFLIDHHQTQNYAQGDLISLHMNDYQQELAAVINWRPEQQLVKRVLATEPGTIITVTKAGVEFEYGSEKWTHGSDLFAAPLFKHITANFERTFTLQPGEIFVMGDRPYSFDGRYYGPISKAQVTGKVLFAW